MRLRLRLKPRDSSFFELLTAQARHLVTGADVLAQAVGSAPEERVALAETISGIEHQADEDAHAILRQINSTFVTPFDRDDIYRLVNCIDDCIDAMEEAVDRMVLYRVDTLPDAMVKQVEVLQRCAELTVEAIPGLRAMASLSTYWVEINRLENEADKIYRTLLADLYDGETPAGSDPIAVMKLREIVEDLEESADAFERLAGAVETIALKEA